MQKLNFKHYAAGTIAAIVIASQFPVIGDSADRFGSWQPEELNGTDSDMQCLDDCTRPIITSWAEYTDQGCTEESAATDSDCLDFAHNNKTEGGN